MSYVHSSLILTKPQMGKLVTGGSITVSPKRSTSLHNHHTVPIFLTRMQHARISHAMKSKRGARLGFSKTQLHHHIRHGGGWSDIFNRVKSGATKAFEYAAPLAKQAAKAAVKYGASKAKDYIADNHEKLIDHAFKAANSKIKTGNSQVDGVIGSVLSKGQSAAKDHLPSLANKGIDLAVNKMFGSGIRRRRKRSGGCAIGSCPKFGTGVVVPGYGRGVTLPGY